MPLKNRLLSEVRTYKYVPLSQPEGVASQGGYKSATMERKMRLLVEEGKVDPSKNSKGYITGYRLV